MASIFFLSLTLRQSNWLFQFEAKSTPFKMKETK
jgi:hypothetical protein